MLSNFDSVQKNVCGNRLSCFQNFYFDSGLGLYVMTIYSLFLQQYSRPFYKLSKLVFVLQIARSYETKLHTFTPAVTKIGQLCSHI